MSWSSVNINLNYITVYIKSILLYCIVFCTFVDVQYHIMRKILLAFLMLMTFLAGAAKLEKENARLADELGDLFSNFDELSMRPLHKIDSLHRELTSSRNQLSMSEARNRLGDEYIEHNIDSAMFYWHTAMRDALLENKDIDSKIIRLKIISYLPFQGMGLDAMRYLEEFKVSELPDSLRQHYWVCASRMFSTLRDLQPPGLLKEQYRQKSITALDSLSNYYPVGSPVNSYIISVMHYVSGDEHLAVANISQLLPYFVNYSLLYEIAQGKLIDYYSGKPQYRQEYIKSVFLLTKNSMQRGVVNPAIMAQAGKILYEEGFKILGRSMILKAMKSKLSGATSYRRFDHTEYIDYLYGKAYNLRIWLAILFGIIVIAFVFLAFFSVRSVKNSRRHIELMEKRLSDLESRNTELHKSLDSAIDLSFLSNEQLREYNLHVQRKLKTGLVRDLYRDIESGNYMEELHRTFFDNFDKLFMENFPDFVDKLNLLLLPDKQLQLLPGNHLSPELRIAAYMRFGINDSSKLAKALGLSLNTIYAYRNRLKGRAIDRANFEENLMNMVAG